MSGQLRVASYGSLTLEQAQEPLRAAGGSHLYAYVVLSVTTGLRTEERRVPRAASATSR